MVPGDDVGAAELAVHTEGSHLRLQSVPQFLPRLQVPDEVGLRVVQLESLKAEEVVSMVSSKRNGIWLNAVKRRNRPVVEKLPVHFDLYSLPSLPQDDWLLVRVLQTNKSTTILFFDEEKNSTMWGTLHIDCDTRNKNIEVLLSKVAERLRKDILIIDTSSTLEV